jgi:putative cell wall-binding protein
VPEPGSEQDPLISRSYLEQYVAQQIGTTLGQTVVLTRGDIPFDSIAVAPLVQKFNAVMLLTTPQTLSMEAGRAFKALQPKKIFIIGGPVAVSQQIENQLRSSLPQAEIIRIEGATRYETAEKIAAAASGRTW